MKIAVIGATGLVGRTMLEVLAEWMGDSVKTVWAAASERSVGQTVEWRGGQVPVESVAEVLRRRPDVVLMSAGAGVSGEWAPRFAETGAYVIDNSSRWRMDPSVPLVVPEVNVSALQAERRIIANPNCSTIQLVVPLAVIHRLYGVRRVHVSTYQAVSGSGWKGLAQLEAERHGREVEDPAYSTPIDGNCLPVCGDMEGIYTTEEWKLIRESRKIMDMPELEVVPHAVRVPVEVGHSEAVTVETHRPVEVDALRAAMRESPGIRLMDPPPTPREAAGHDTVFVGRIRPHPFSRQGVMLWVVADNLRKGAATNAVQILEAIYRRGWLGR